jgi:hypothetical protein
LTAGIAHGRGDHPWQAPKTLFGPPKTAATKNSFLLPGQGWGFDRCAEHGMQGGTRPITRLAPICLLKQSEHGDSFQWR